MKSQKGVTIVSLIIYVMSFFAICGVVAVITNFFYNNTKVFSNEASSSMEYDMLNAYLVKEIQQSENLVTVKYKDRTKKIIDEISFKNGNRYIFEKEAEEIYGRVIFSNEDKTKYFILSDNIESFKVTDSNGDEVVTQTDNIKIEVQILGKKYTQSYTIEK